MSDITTKLMEAAKGLEYPSEEDQPFEPVELSSEQYRKLKSEREYTLNEFFNELEENTDTEPLDGEEDESVKWYKLKLALRRNLKKIEIFDVRESSTRVTTYLIGLVDGHGATMYAGLKVLSVET